MPSTSRELPLALSIPDEESLDLLEVSLGAWIDTLIEEVMTGQATSIEEDAWRRKVDLCRELLRQINPRSAFLPENGHVDRDTRLFDLTPEDAPQNHKLRLDKQ